MGQVMALPMPMPMMPPPMMPPMLPVVSLPTPQFDVQNVESTLNNSPLMEYVCTFEGARFVCSKLHNAADFATLFGSLLPLLPRLMVNSVGHSVCRALYREAHCSFAQKQQF